MHLDGAGMEVGHALHRRIAQSSKLWRPLVAERTHCSNIVRNGAPAVPDNVVVVANDVELN